ncbi:MAG: S8 family serine peptidase, partial [Rickettsiaceae bacterium]|nr:S8 family serine peptidase [Rickettsiaceae bacterium]
MRQLHNKLYQSVPLYRDWHNKAYASVVHFLLLAFFCTLLSNSLTTQINLSGELVANAINANSSANVLFTSKNTGRAGDRILVKFKKGTPQSKRDSVLSQRKLHKKSSIKNIDVDVLNIDPNVTPEEAVQALLAQNGSDIEYAEVDKVVTPTFLPDDPSFSGQWDKILVNTPLAWDTTKGTSTIIVGVSDTGVDCTHEDLAANCVPGWNIPADNSNTADTYGHGTAVAGVIAAVGNNGKGIAGTAWNVKIMPLRIDDPTNPLLPAGSAYMSTIANSVIYAADHGVKVVNNSFGGYSSSLDSAAQYLASKTGGIFVRSEGNSGADSGLPNNPNLFMVGGTDPNDSLYSWSTFGQNVDIVAPGCSTTTTAMGGGYRSFCGTSNAAPEVSGLLALMYSVNPNLNAQTAASALISTAKDLGTPGW